MILRRAIHEQSAQILVKKCTALNSDLERMERMLGRKMPHLRTIKLYYKEGEYGYFPHGQMQGTLKKRLSLSTPFSYQGQPTDEQVDVAERIMFGTRAGLIEMKTGKGKGHIIMNIIDIHQEPTLVVVHNTATLAEMITKFKEYSNYDPGVYYGKKKNIKEITITTHASFTQATDKFRSSFGVVIIDECDYSFTEKMIKAITTCDADALYGLTGTPQTKELSTEDMCIVFGEHIKVEGQDNNGYNIIPQIDRIKYTTDKYFSFKDRHDLSEQMVHDEDRRLHQLNIIKRYIDSGDTKYGLLLLRKREDECDIYHQMLKDLGINVCIVNGKTKTADDKINIEKIHETGGIIVGTVGKVGRGVDIPFVDTVFLFFPNKFESSTIQAVGRCLRNYPGKTKATVVDRCDLPILAQQMYAKQETYKKEYGEDVTINDEKIFDYIKKEEPSLTIK